MKCPTCPEVTLTMTERQGVEIDYCPQCRGVWLDRGELDKLINGYRDRDDDRKDRYYKKEKSFLSEIFD